MILYRSSIKKGGEDYSISYTDSVNGTLAKGSCSYMFAGNQSIKTNNIVIGNNVNSCWRMFEGCYQFNGNVTIPNSVTNVGSMFRNCRNFNQNVIIPNSINNAFLMFGDCWNFNQNVKIPNSVTEAREMFGYCNLKFNYNIQIPNSLINGRGMFVGCYSLNQHIDVTVAENITDCNHMFANCISLDKDILPTTPDCHTWAKKPVSMYGMFEGCTKYDKSVFVPDNATDCSRMLFGCSSFYSSVDFNSACIVRNISHICDGCDRPTIGFIPNGVLDMSYACANCRNIQDAWFDIGTGVNNCDGVLFNCNNFNGTLNFLGNVSRKISMKGIFSTSMTKKKNIYFGNAINGQINKLSVVSPNLYITPTWTTTSYGYYNATYNIYCYWR